MTARVYQTSGHLTGTIDDENVEVAQEYLLGTADEPVHMEQYLDEPLKSVVTSLNWHLADDGHNYTIIAHTTRLLKPAELKKLSEECSGQNSDGHGEGFEQQPFAELHEDCGACYACGAGYGCDDSYDGMIKFDWETNDLPFVLVS